MQLNLIVVTNNSKKHRYQISFLFEKDQKPSNLSFLTSKPREFNKNISISHAKIKLPT